MRMGTRECASLPSHLGSLVARPQARNALSKLPYLEQITKLGAISRAQGMPWRDKYGD